eukprot:2756967-Prorocentrum_lima.AAC.1
MVCKNFAACEKIGHKGNLAKALVVFLLFWLAGTWLLTSTCNGAIGKHTAGHSGRFHHGGSAAGASGSSTGEESSYGR